MSKVQEFAIKALAFKLKSFYPTMSETKLRKLVEVVETNMRSGKSTDVKYRSTLAEMGIAFPAEIDRITKCQIDVSAAVFALGSDIPNGKVTIDDIIWNC